MIPNNITHQHILNAIQEIDEGREIPLDREPHKYNLIHNDKLYPPKFIISLSNKYANGNELESEKFSGGEETNGFLKARGFEVVPIEPVRYDDRLFEYLKSIFKVEIDKIKRSWLRLRLSGSIMYVNGSKEYDREKDGWYDLEKEIFLELTKSPSSYYALVLGDPSKTFVIPSYIVKDIFANEATIVSTEDVKKRPRWMFTVQPSSQGYTLSVKNSNFDITSYLNNWSQIPGFGDGSKPILNVFVTGYDDVNLNHSIAYKTLGWRNQSHILSNGDYVFVYNKTSHKIQAAFKVLAKSINTDPIWEEELKSKAQKIEFPNRWDAEVICDDLAIDLDTISSFEPFNGNAVNKFVPLIGNNNPTPLSNEKYADFNKFLLERCEKAPSDSKVQQETYWKIAPGENASLWNEQLTNGIVAIGWNELGDLTNRDMNDIIDDIKNNWPDSYSSIVPQIRDFLSIKVGDIVIANKGISRVVGIGRIVGKYQHRPDLAFHHAYPVEWFNTTERNITPQKGTWVKTVGKVSQQLFNEIMTGIRNHYLLFRHQPAYKRNKSDRQYWSDLLGKEYHFGKGVVNHKKVQPGTKTVWYYTDQDKIYLWGYGEVNDVRPAPNDEFIATYTDFNFINEGSPVEAESSIQNKIKSLNTWSPYNSIIEITEDIFNEIVQTPMQLDTFEDEPLPIPTSDDIKQGYEEISKLLLIPKDKVIEILAELASGNHVLLAGPIGTGKTQLAKMIPEVFWKKYGGYYADDFTATSDWNTQDVIGGIYPKMHDHNVEYDIQYGCVVDTVIKNWEEGLNGGRRIKRKFPQKSSPYRGVWLIIDEFNRSDIDKAFGQLFTSLRTRSLKVPTTEIRKSSKDLKIPRDYRIIGTLNTADKHFLFQISDALKSRFAYILIDTPKSTEYEKEIYYAIKNANSSLPLGNYDNILLISDDENKVSKVESNPDFYDRVLQAYYYLDTVRIFKKLGTGILQRIFQNMLISIKMTGDAEKSLDNSLTSTLIPQLENLPIAELGACEALYNGSVVQYFKDAYKRPNRQSYSDTFEKVMEYLQVNNSKQLRDRFSNGNLSPEDAGWTTIQNAAEERGKRFSLGIRQFISAISDLKKSAVV